MLLFIVPASNNQFDEALISLQAAQKDVGLELVNSTALTRLKTGLESQGKVFPFTIPSKVGTIFLSSDCELLLYNNKFFAKLEELFKEI
jgi:hypothetical protein